MAHKDPLHTSARGRGQSAASVNLEARDRMGEKPVHEVLIEGAREIHYIRRPGDCLQMVYEGGKLVHLDCKAPACGNNWKAERGQPMEDQFRIDRFLGRTVVVCLNCERDYLVTQVSVSPSVQGQGVDTRNAAD